MTPKEQAIKNIEGRIETIQTLSTECMELIYNAGYNEAIEAAAIACDAEGDYNPASYYCEAIRSLKK